MIHRKVPETPAPMSEPASCKRGNPLLTAVAAKAMPMLMTNTTVEWPNEKKNPTPNDGLFFCSRYRTVSSTAAIWSASKA